MRYFAAIYVVLFCFIGSGMSHTKEPCITCDSIPSDSVKRMLAEDSKDVVKEAMDSLKSRFSEVQTKNEILILKTAMLERKMCKEYVGRVDSFRTFTGFWVVTWYYNHNGYTRVKYDSIRNRNRKDSPKVYRAD